MSESVIMFQFLMFCSLAVGASYVFVYLNFKRVLHQLNVFKLGCHTIFAQHVENFSKLNLKIVEGRDTPIEEIPFQVAIERHGKLFCGGTILTPKHVLTAGHCFVYYNSPDSPENFTVRAGTSKLENGGKVIKISKFTAHPNFDPMTFDYDVTVLDLAELIPISKKSQPIALAVSEPMPGTIVTTSGWGLLNATSFPSKMLQSVEIPVVDRVTCNISYSTMKPPVPVNDLKICAGGEEKGGCKGDSGGPLFAQRTDGSKVLVGIVSWAKEGCATVGYPGGYTNIAQPEIRQFILKNAGLSP